MKGLLRFRKDMNKLVNRLKKANFIYIIGNGGSASTADHLANDLVKQCRLKAISLCSNSAILTAIANDYDYRVVFLDQLMVFLTPDDMLITISTSGQSKNILYAIDYANLIGADVYEFPKGDTMSTEDYHMQLIHKIVRKFKECVNYQY